MITVPAHYEQRHNDMIEELCVKAGFNKVELLSAPMAAIKAFGLDQQNFDKKVVVFQLGGSTCEVSLVELSGN